MKLAIQLTALALAGATGAYARDIPRLGGATALVDIMDAESEDYNPNKKDKSQKRAEQREDRRRSQNPNRTRKEYQAEKDRKRRQYERSGRRDPWDPDNGKKNWGQDQDRKADRRYDDCRRRCARSTSSNCRCEDLEPEEAEIVADFFENYEDADFIVDFLFDVFAENEGL